jgi:hypothetical protein
VDHIDDAPITDHDVERVLARVLVAWAVGGALLVTFWGVLFGVLSFFALAFWIAYALAGTVLGALAIQHCWSATSRPVGLALAAVVPVVTVVLWLGAGVLYAGGNALTAWVRAI